ncbi:hypothetical protein B0H10DRAFT_2445679, partial [Mycena sp. CBHHK59/15]
MRRQMCLRVYEFRAPYTTNLYLPPRTHGVRMWRHIEAEMQGVREQDGDGQGGRNLVQGAAIRDVRVEVAPGDEHGVGGNASTTPCCRKVRVLRCRLPSSNRVWASAPSRTSDRLAQLFCPRRSSGS